MARGAQRQRSNRVWIAWGFGGAMETVADRHRPFGYPKTDSIGVIAPLGYGVLRWRMYKWPDDAGSQGPRMLRYLQLLVITSDNSDSNSRRISY